ncbi:MAG: ribonuclease HI family protein [Candidatus Bathyarchaeota archaeon]|nr:MAG: ribonuclease HI family protein [Candidatus Bathyarchaeota archaeon]
MQKESGPHLTVYSDGASRGNPGPAAIAGEISSENGALLKAFSRFLGKRTNNEAEYEALIAALEIARHLTDDQVDCFLDSELVVKQLNGEYRVRNPRLRRLWEKTCELCKSFSSVSFNHALRRNEHIDRVDSQANSVLDKVLGQ